MTRHASNSATRRRREKLERGATGIRVESFVGYPVLEGNPLDPLIVFDFDDTLVHVAQKIRISRADGSVDLMRSCEYNSVIRRPGDEIDWNEFETHYEDAKALEPMFSVFEQALRELGPTHVAVVTARSKPIPLRKFIEKHVGHMPVTYCCDCIEVFAKVAWLRNKIASDGHDYIVFFDDRIDYVQAIANLTSEFPSTRIFTNWVRPGKAKLSELPKPRRQWRDVRRLYR